MPRISRKAREGLALQEVEMLLNPPAPEKERKHAVYGASNAERWVNCAGSTRLCATVPPAPDSPASLEGTAGHAVLEALLRSVDPDYTAREELELFYPNDMIEHAFEAMLWIKKRRDEVRGELLVEARVDASSFTTDGQFGTLDAAIVDLYGRLVVIDYKYGYGVVEPEGAGGGANKQLAYYALGVAHKYGYDFSEVELVILQPRAYHTSGNKARSHVVTMAQLLTYREVFQQAVFRSKDPNAPLTAGPWCKYCPAGLICPALKGESLEAAGLDLDLPTLPAPTLTPVPRLGAMLDAAERLEEWIRQLREHAQAALHRGEEVDGWKLVAKRGHRRWTNEKAVAEAARKIWGDKAFTVPELLSPSQFEKAPLKANKEWLKKFTTSESSGVALVRTENKRPAVVPATKVFGEWTPPDVAAKAREYLEAAVKPFPPELSGKLVAAKKKRRNNQVWTP